MALPGGHAPAFTSAAAAAAPGDAAIGLRPNDLYYQGVPGRRHRVLQRVYPDTQRQQRGQHAVVPASLGPDLGRGGHPA